MSDPDHLDIPDFLRVTPEEAARRKERWIKNPPQPWPQDAKRQSTFAARDAEDRRKAQERIAKLKAEHPDRHWNSKTQQWEWDK